MTTVISACFASGMQTSSTSTASSCMARPAAAPDLPSHPCFNEAAHGRVARIHIPVAPRCNLACAYCERILSPEHVPSGPGATANVVTPQAGVARALRFLHTYGEESIVGIAGPGDPLANDESLIFLDMLRSAAPHALTCLCTNGLALPQHAQRLIKLGVRTLTVTMNGTSPEVVAAMQPRAYDGQTWLAGTDAARLLLQRQEEGLRAVAGHMIIKVNMVVAPGINMHEAPAVMRRAQQLGAQVFNPMPLIPRHALHHARKPTRDELHTLYAQCPPGMTLFRKCKQCRADAAGIHGKESFGCQTIDQE